MTNRYNELFKNLKKANKIALIPFVTIGDPDIEISQEIIKCLIKSGADALELGIAFSDPIADGQVIQKANTRALNSGITIDKSLKIISNIRKFNKKIPIGLLIYGNLILAKGIELFFKLAYNSGVDSVLIVDVPLIESKKFFSLAKKHKIDLIYIIPPNADNTYISYISKYTKSYCYFMSRSGVTGKKINSDNINYELIKELKKKNAPPIVVGFGVSEPKHIKEIKKSGADGAIVGSALINIIANNYKFPSFLQEKISSYIQNLKKET